MAQEDEALQAQMSQLKLDSQLNDQASAQARLFQSQPPSQYGDQSHGFPPHHFGAMDGHNGRNFTNAYPIYNAQTREAHMYFGGGAHDSNAMASNMNQIQAFYPQGHPLSHMSMQNQNNFGLSSEQQPQHGMMNFQNLQQHQQHFNRLQQQMQRSADIANFDLQIANPYGQHQQTPGQLIGPQAPVEPVDTSNRQQARPTQRQGSGGLHQQHAGSHQMGLASDLVVDDQDEVKELYSKTNEEHLVDGGGLGGSMSQQPSQVMNSSRSSHQAQSKHQSKTAQAAHELSASQKSSTGKGNLNSGSDSNQVSSGLQQFSQRKRGSARADPSIGSRDNSKGKNKGVTSRGAASDDGQIILSSQSQYDSQNSKDNAVFSNKPQKQLF